MLPVLFMFLIGTITIGMGIFYYQLVAGMAREGARYASVHGPVCAGPDRADQKNRNSRYFCNDLF